MRELGERDALDQRLQPFPIIVIKLPMIVIKLPMEQGSACYNVNYATPHSTSDPT